MTFSTTSSQVQAAHLEACVHESLRLHLYENARWLGERLVALAATEVMNGVIIFMKSREATQRASFPWSTFSGF